MMMAMGGGMDTNATIKPSNNKNNMLVWGTVNPDGEDNAHTGVLLRERDIADLSSTNALVGKPVKIEHRGGDVGRVLHAWQHGGRLDCILEIHRNTAESLFAQSFIQMGKTPELSLGYSVTMCQSAASGEIRGGKKDVLEVSLVKKGARHNCYVRGFEKNASGGGGSGSG
jgi:hypothetical protein